MTDTKDKEEVELPRIMEPAYRLGFDRGVAQGRKGERERLKAKLNRVEIVEERDRGLTRTVFMDVVFSKDLEEDNKEEPFF